MEHLPRVETARVSDSHRDGSRPKCGRTRECSRSNPKPYPRYPSNSGFPNPTDLHVGGNFPEITPRIKRSSSVNIRPAIAACFSPKHGFWFNGELLPRD